MLRPRQLRVKFYEDMKEALAPSKVTPIKYDRPTSIGSGAEAAGVVGKRLLAAYLAKQKKDAEAADIKAAGAMLDKFYAPQEEWNEEEYGSTPDTLRAATMPGALTADVGSQEMPIESYGAMGPDGMPAALGAPNAALGAPIDIEQPYALGTDEEDDDANWMSAPEHAEFYKRAAAEAQTEFDAENVPGLPAVMKADRGGAYNTANGVRGPRSEAMLAALRGEGRALGMEKAERDRTLATTIAEEKREQANAMELKAAPGNTKAGADTANIKDYKFQKELEDKYPPTIGPDGEKIDSPQVVAFKMNLGGNRPVDGGNEYYVKDQRTGEWKSIIKKGLNPKDDPKYQTLIENQKQQQTRAQLRIDGGVSASKAIPDIKRSIQLLSGIKTGGIDALKLWAKGKFGVETGDEGLLSNMLAKNVLSQLRQTFGAAFTAKEGQWLKEIEAGIGKSNAGNLAILNRVLKKAENYYQIGLSSADIMGDNSTMEAMKLQYGLDKTPEAEKQTSTSSTGPSLEDLKALQAKRLKEKMLKAAQSQNLGGRISGY